MSLAAIHIRKKELGLSDEDYRSLLYRIAGVRSAKDLTQEGDQAVMRALYAMQKPRPRLTPQAAKIWAVWYALKGHLPPAAGNTAYLLGMINHASGSHLASADQIPSLTTYQAKKAIDALNARLACEEEKLKEEVPF